MGVLCVEKIYVLVPVDKRGGKEVYVPIRIYGNSALF